MSETHVKARISLTETYTLLYVTSWWQP